MLATFSSILLTWTATLALCAWSGWGVTKFVTPPALRPYRVALTLLVGYVAVTWVGYNAVHSFLSLKEALPFLLLMSTVFNVAAFNASRSDQAALRISLEKFRHFRHLAAPPLGLILVASLLVGVLPLLHYGYVTIIGGGWDFESYLALSAHLQNYQLADIDKAPSSPLGDHVRNPPIIGLSMGHSIVQGFVGILTRQSELQTFAALQALMRTLGFVAVYVWLRTTMGLRRVPALWATALTAAGALLLWVSYFNFGMQLAAWPLLPLGLTVGVAAVEDVVDRGRQAWPGVVLAALIWATMPMMYYPVLTAAVPMAVGSAIALLIAQEERIGLTRRRARVRAVMGILALLFLTVPLSTWVISDYYAGFDYRYANPLTTLGLFRFIPLSDILGWTAFDLREVREPIPPIVLVIAMALSCTLALAALTGGPVRIRWAAAILGAALYLLWVRYGRVYHYAYMKGGAYVGFVAAGLLAAGWQGLADRSGRIGRVGGSITVSFLLALAAFAQSQVVRDHWAGPALVAPAVAALDQVANTLMPRDATVLLTGDPQWSGPQMSIIASALYPRPLRGHVVTAYSGLDQMPQGEQPDFVLLSEHERPAMLGLPEAEEIWSNGGLRLYAMPTSGHPSLLLGRDEAGLAIPGREPSVLQIRRWGGGHRLINSSQPLRLQIADRLGYGTSSAADTRHTRVLTLDVAALEKTELLMSDSNGSQTLMLPPGVSTITLPVLSTWLELKATQPVALLRARSADAIPSSNNSATLTRAQDDEWLVWQPTVEMTDDIINLRLAVTNPAKRSVRFELSVVSDTYERPTNALTLLAAPPLNGTLQLRLDLAKGTADTRVEEVPIPLLDLVASPTLPDDQYFGMLSILDGDERIAQVPLWTVTLNSSIPTTIEPLPVTIETALLGPRRNAESRRNLPVGAGEMELVVAQLNQPTVAPGGRLAAQLVWEAETTIPMQPMISVQVLGADDHKWGQWDGQLGGWAPAITWQPGQQVRQDVPLTLDAATPPGRYRVLLVAYDPATGQPLTIGGQAALELEELEVK